MSKEWSTTSSKQHFPDTKGLTDIWIQWDCYSMFMNCMRLIQKESNKQIQKKKKQPNNQTKNLALRNWPKVTLLTKKKCFQLITFQKKKISIFQWKNVLLHVFCNVAVRISANSYAVITFCYSNISSTKYSL